MVSVMIMGSDPIAGVNWHGWVQNEKSLITSDTEHITDN
jgi:hypothetical protein